jgi:protein involved in polysaccharide export with SLBB domain
VIVKTGTTCLSGEADACAECSGCKAGCSTACAADLQRTGLDPYRIEPPDVLSIYVPMLEPKSAEIRKKLAAKGISLDGELPFGNAEFQQLVAPDGHVYINEIGNVYVAGMTVEEARLAITKKIYEACPEASRAAFAVVVDVSAANSKKYYVITEAADSGNNVTESPITGNETVLTAIARIGGISQVSSMNIWIARPATNGNGGEQILPVNWNEISRGGNTATNYQLLPGDRLYIESAREPQAQQPPKPVAMTLSAIALPPTPYCAAQSTAAAQLSPPIAPVGPYSSSVPSTTYYSAFPEPVPLPFARQATPSILSPPLIATQSFISDVPEPVLPAPPAPVALAPQCTAAEGACCSASCGTSTGSCASCSECPESSTKVAQVLFNVQVIEDPTGSLQEFKALQSDMRILTAESEVILPMIRLLEKRDLLRRCSSPKVAAVVDRPVQLEIGNQERNLMLKTTARELGGGLNVDFQFKDTRGNDTLEVETSLLIAHGQTIVMKAKEPDSRPGPAVYVVLTPELVK